MYYIFSTLPLDVENIVIHTENLKVAKKGRCCLFGVSTIAFLIEKHRADCCMMPDDDVCKNTKAESILISV